MFGIKDKNSEAAMPAVDLGSRPELWVPPHLAERMPDALNAVRAHVSILSEPTWLEALPNKLTRHLRTSIAARDYDGKQPGTFSRPNTGSRMISKPDLSIGTGILYSMQPMTEEDFSEQDHEDWRQYRWSQQHEGDFSSKVAAAFEEVMSDAGRAWDAHLHLRALEDAQRAEDRSRKAAEDERRRLSIQRCPVCTSSDAKRIGPVETRTLIGTKPYSLDGIPSLRSCLACWHVAHAAYMETMAAETMMAAVGDSTRHQLVSTAVRDLLADQVGRAG